MTTRISHVRVEFTYETGVVRAFELDITDDDADCCEIQVENDVVLTSVVDGWAENALGPKSTLRLTARGDRVAQQ